MIRNKLIIFLFLFCINGVSAQFYVRKNPTKWMVALNWSFIQDAGLGIQKAFDFTNTFNYDVFPTQFVFTKNIRKAWSWELVGTYNSFSESTIVNCVRNNGGVFTAADGYLQYSFAKHDLRRKKLAKLEPFIGVGVGASYREMLDLPITPTLNAALGTNLFITQQIGIQLRAVGKYGVGAELWSTEANYMNYTAGLVYRKVPKKARSKTDRKKKHKGIHKKPRYKKNRGHKVR